MNVIDIVIAVGAVTKVTKVDIAGERNTGSYIIRIFEPCRTWLLKIINILIYCIKDLADGILPVRPLAEDIPVARLDIHLYSCNACSVLAPVMLLLHHQVHFLESIAPGTVFLNIVFERLA